MKNWRLLEEVYQLEIYENENADEYTEIKIEDKVYAFKIAEELLLTGKTVIVRRETYFE